jgi:hypothetical protein
VEARRPAFRHPEVAEAHPAPHQDPQSHPEEAQWELEEVTKAHPESEDPEVVHHPARQIRLTCPEQLGVEVEVEVEARHRAAASLHHRLHHHRLLCPYREWELLAAWVAGSDVRPESACQPAPLVYLVLHPEMARESGVAPSFSRLVVHPEFSIPWTTC